MGDTQWRAVVGGVGRVVVVSLIGADELPQATAVHEDVGGGVLAGRQEGEGRHVAPLQMLMLLVEEVQQAHRGCGSVIHQLVVQASWDAQCNRLHGQPDGASSTSSNGSNGSSDAGQGGEIRWDEDAGDVVVDALAVRAAEPLQDRGTQSLSLPLCEGHRGMGRHGRWLARVGGEELFAYGTICFVTHHHR